MVFLNEPPLIASFSLGFWPLLGFSLSAQPAQPDDSRFGGAVPDLHGLVDHINRVVLSNLDAPRR